VNVRLLTGRWVILWLWLLCPGSPLLSSEPAAEEAVRRQQAEVDRLQEELRRAEAELNRIRVEGARAAEMPAAVPESSQPVVGQGAVEVAPHSETEPRPDTEAPASGMMVVTAERLVREFAADPDAAEARYAKRRIRVSGAISGFQLPLARRIYELRLESPERDIDLICRFSYVDVYRSVYAENNGRELVARGEQRVTRVLHRRGEQVTLVGKCQGLKKGVIRLTDCSIVD